MDLSELSLSIIDSTFPYPGNPIMPTLCKFEPFNLGILHGWVRGAATKKGAALGEEEALCHPQQSGATALSVLPSADKDEMPQATG